MGQELKKGEGRKDSLEGLKIDKEHLGGKKNTEELV